MIEDINEFVNRMDATPTNSASPASCNCSCHCSCPYGAAAQLGYTPGQMSGQGQFFIQ